MMRLATIRYRDKILSLNKALSFNNTLKGVTNSGSRFILKDTLSNNSKIKYKYLRVNLVCNNWIGHKGTLSDQIKNTNDSISDIAYNEGDESEWKMSWF